MNADRAPQIGNIYAYFVMRKDKVERVICNIQSEGNKDYLRIIWGNTGTVSLTYKQSRGSTTDKNYHFDGYTDTERRINILLKTQNKKFDLWLNGEKLLSDRVDRVSDVACSLTNFRFYLEGTDFGVATVDDIRVYSKKLITEGIAISEGGKTATYTFAGKVPEDCTNCAVVIAVYDNPEELADVRIGYFNGNTATVSIEALSAGQTLKYMVRKSMESVVPLVKSIEKIVE